MVGLTLTRYLSVRFAKAIAGVFATIFLLIYLIDFVEMLRRSAGLSNATTGLVALLCLLRVPSVTEQVLPFAVLAGSLFAFVSLSRRLELVVARAAGISVWQFLVPPVLIVVLIGIVSVAIYNPLSAAFKERADSIETSLFKGPSTGVDTSMWIRQRSPDGQSILRAEQSSDNGRHLSAVTAFVYNPNGSFKERVEAAEATLTPGFWILSDARVAAPDVESKPMTTYRLATSLSAEQVTQSFVAPEAVSFWNLAETARRIEGAGLDGNRYRLRFQSLLARPLMLVAMVLIAASFSLRFFRFGGIPKMVSGGVLAGFVLYVATKLIGDLGGAGLLSASVAAWSPAVIGSLLGTLVLLHQEDG
jgi:lipopolysaccharide export system permease protein